MFRVKVFTSCQNTGRRATYVAVVRAASVTEAKRNVLCRDDLAEANILSIEVERV